MHAPNGIQVDHKRRGQLQYRSSGNRGRNGVRGWATSMQYVFAMWQLSTVDFAASLWFYGYS